MCLGRAARLGARLASASIAVLASAPLGLALGSGVALGCREDAPADGAAAASAATPAAPTEAPLGAPQSDRPHLVLIVIDTLRADHLGSYGYRRETSPVIDELAAQGLRFERVIAPSSWTLPSLVTLMTGRHPSPAHLGVLDPGVSERGMDALAPEAVTLAERLADAGYRTAAVGTNPYQMQPVFRLMQGFESLEVEVSNPADWVVGRGIAQLDAPRGDAPLFLYLHFMDAHSPYESPPPFASLFGGDASEPPSPEHVHPEGVASRAALGTPEFEAMRADTIALYDGAIRFIDSQIGRFVEALEQRGLRDETVLVITADHGEAFWDHVALERRLDLGMTSKLTYGAGHGQSLFPELIQVPLVIQGANVPRGATVARQVRLVDVPPTLLALSGLSPDAIRGHGIDLLAFAEEPERDLRGISETSAGGVALRALVTPQHTLLRADGEPLLLREADGRLRDATQQQPHLLDSLRQELAQRSEALPRAEAAPAHIQWQNLEEQLRELGYVVE